MRSKQDAARSGTKAADRAVTGNTANDGGLALQGLKVLELGLHFGGNDVGSVMLEENVVKAAGTSNCTAAEELRRIGQENGRPDLNRLNLDVDQGFLLDQCIEQDDLFGESPLCGANLFRVALSQLVTAPDVLSVWAASADWL